MQRTTNQAIIIFFSALSILLLYLLAPILSPFLLGALLAYLANPMVKHLEKWGLPHILSVTAIFVFLFLVVVLIILMLFPLVEKQITLLIEEIPQILTWVQDSLLPRFQGLINLTTVKATLTSSLAKTGVIVTTVMNSGYAIVEWFVNLVLTPIVTFYFLRDWDKILRGVRNLLPRSIEPIVVQLAKECDAVLGQFFRGQLLVMLALSFIYGIGLTVIGLQLGLVIGIVGGLLSIVPYLGSGFVLIAASIAAFVQFGSWHALFMVWLVFIIGQTIEGYVLTPYLVGERIGLHPVAVIFAVMAGGALFGFFGVLVALPAAAVIMVLVRHLNERYHLSKFYKH